MLQRLDKLMTMCASVDGVYLALIGDGALGPTLSERHRSWSNSGKRRTKVQVDVSIRWCLILAI